jgi:uncharacterized OB-fold protein
MRTASRILTLNNSEAIAPPVADALQAWRVAESGFKLQASVCDHCKQLSFPPARDCSHCTGYSDDPQLKPLAGTGALYSFTTIHVGGNGFDAPYAIGFVDIDEGLRVVAQLRFDDKPLRSGAPVVVEKAVIRHIGDQAVEGYAFRVVGSPTAP